MCGVVGVFAPRDAAGWRPAVDRAVKTLAHRGPDDHGVEVVCAAEGRGRGAGAVLGNTRLAILDLSPAGHMPMASPGGDVWITYNGELFNFHEIRAALEALGHTFGSTGDTEVLLHAYLQWGDAFLPRLNGMFALAIADVRGGRLRCLLARDQLGVKPCYYAERAGTLTFASEIKGLFALGLASAEVDWQSVWDYFSYLYVPGPATMYRDVRQLPPAHALVWEADGVCAVHRYWTPLPDANATPPVGAAEAVVELRALVSDAVRRQLISDVPLGVFLSGGIDSTILTALAAQASAKPVKTFTVLFQGEGIGAVDDRLYARQVSARYGTEHHELVVDVEPDALLDMVTVFDQPFGNPTGYLSYLISSLTREHVTVALSGAGGDELFGGYPRYRALPYAGILARVPRAVGRAVAAGLTRLLPEDFEDPWRRRVKLLLRGVGYPLAEQYLRWTYYLADEDKARLLAPAAARMIDRRPSARWLAQRLAQAATLPDLGTRIQYVDLETFLADNILEYTDRTSMAASLEVRVPLLDPRVVEWSFRQRFSDKLSGGVSKKILRTAFGDLIPPQNLAAPKRGFCPPLAAWMRRLDRYFDEHMGPTYVARQGIFDWPAIEALRQAHRARRRDTSMELFGIIMFDVWWRRYVEGER